MNVDDIPEEIRAMLDGEGTEPQTFTAWVNEMSPAERAEIFGPAKAGRWEDGSITPREMIDQSGRPLKNVQPNAA
jgi:hypothetical protein